MVPLAAIQPLLVMELAEHDVQVLVQADQGGAAAQADIGALFALAALREAQEMASTGRRSRARAALYFLMLAAQQGEADAMHWLSILHTAGLGEPGEDGGHARSLMWMAKAAANGHVIAQGQVAALFASELQER